MQIRARSLVATLLVAGAVAACRSDSPSPVAPSAAVAFKKVKNATTSDTVTVVTRKTAFAADSTVSAVIGSAGGTLDFPAAGLTLTVPKGAVSSNQTFTITAMAGSLIAYEFTPHTTFAQPLQLRQQLAVLNIPANTSATTVGYFATRADLGQTDEEVGTIQEQLPLTFDFTNGGSAKFSVTHFSGYLMASGRSAAY